MNTTTTKVDGQLEMRIADAQSQVDYLNGRLRQEALSLADKMQTLAGSLEGGGSFNDLGEVQGRGSDIDRLCGQLAQARGFVQQLNALRLVAGEEA